MPAAASGWAPLFDVPLLARASPAASVRATAGLEAATAGAGSLSSISTGRVTQSTEPAAATMPVKAESHGSIPARAGAGVS
jgi:hypothetical protein